MPTYQYACTDCAERIEVVQKFTDEPLLVCGTCGGRLRKVFSPVGIVFKGSGFYRTDSRAGAKKDKALNGSSENGSGPADSGSSADAKSGDKDKKDKKADKSAAASSSGAGSGSSSGNGSGSSSPAGSASSGKSSSSSGSKVA